MSCNVAAGKQKGSIMDNTNKVKKWSFIFCNFFLAKDRAQFKAKMKKRGIATDFLNQYNLIIVSDRNARGVILANIPDRATFQELQVSDEQFKNMENFKGGKA